MSRFYVGIIGDIVDSRKLSAERRSEVQIALDSLLDKVNTKYSSFIVSKFIITLGDEFQGLLTSSAPVYEIVSLITDGLYPVELRFGLGYGSLSTAIKETAVGMDGPVFYSAREAIGIAEERSGHSIAFRSPVIDDSTISSINVMLQSLSVIRKLWSDNFLKILDLLRGSMTQREIANKLKITQPYVSKLMKNAYWVEVEQLEKRVSSLLKASLSDNNANY